MQLFNGYAIEPVGATGGPVEATKDVHRRALAGAAGSHHREVIALLDGEVQLIKGFDLEIP